MNPLIAALLAAGVISAEEARTLNGLLNDGATRIEAEQRVAAAFANGFENQRSRLIRALDAGNVDYRDPMLPTFWPAEHELLARDVLPTLTGIAQDVALTATVRSGGFADWRTVNEAVIAWTDSHYRSVAGDALGSIPNLDATARDAVADAVNRWQRGELNAGPGPMGLPRLIAELQTVDAFGVDRAARIAVTETTRIFAESERTAAQANPNLEYLVWQTAHDEATCLICAPMEGQRIPKGQATFPGGYYPPAHPNCRCGVTAVTEAAAEAMSGAGGDAVASKGKFDAFPPKVQETIANAERKLSSLTDHEELYVIDAKTGEILGHATGDAENVGLSSADRDKQIGSIITHNHPYDVSFSPGDIQNFTKYKLAEMRAVSSEHIYTLRADWTVVDPSEFRKIHDRMRVAVYDINLDKVLSGELAREVAKARWMHETMLRVLQETEGVKYERLINLY